MKDVLEFKKYCEQFDIHNKNISYKYYHSIRTMQMCEQIAEYLKLSEYDIKLAKQIGLLHDIGRFNQLSIYNSYEDNNLDHAEEGVRVLFELGKIKDYDIKNEDYDVVKKAIKNHNKYEIEEGLTKRELLFSKIVRDGDKLEIIYRLAMQDLPILEDNSEIGKIVEDDFLKEKPIRKNNLNLNEKILLKLAFVFDLNFKISYKYLKENHLYEDIYELVKDKPKFKEYFNKVYDYIDKKSREE